MWLDGCTYAWLDALDALDASCGAVAPEQLPALALPSPNSNVSFPEHEKYMRNLYGFRRFGQISKDPDSNKNAISYEQLIANCNDFAWQVGEVYWKSFWLPRSAGCTAKRNPLGIDFVSMCQLRP